MTQTLRSLLILASLACGAAPGSLEREPPRATPPRTQLVLLGTGTPAADPDRAGPALAIVVGDVPYLVDCGPGVVRQAAAAHRNGVAGLEVTRLARVFVTHLHSDHTVGLPDLAFTPWVLGRRRPLEVWGPPGVAAMSEHVALAWAEDIAVRTQGLEDSPPDGGRIVAHEIEPGRVYSDERITVTALAVDHGSWKHALGYRFETADRTIVVSGDARPSPALIEAARGADVLVHEVYSAAVFAQLPPAIQRYHASFHTSTLELAKIAREAQPGLLVLTHQLFGDPRGEDLVAEIARLYPGRVISGRDLDVF